MSMSILLILSTDDKKQGEADELRFLDDTFWISHLKKKNTHLRKKSKVRTEVRSFTSPRLASPNVSQPFLIDRLGL